jgi:hypothetical protein
MIPKNMALGVSQNFLLTACHFFYFGQCSEHQEIASEMGTSKHKAARAYPQIHRRGHPEYTRTISKSRGRDDSKTATSRIKYSSTKVSFQIFFLKLEKNH